MIQIWKCVICDACFGCDYYMGSNRIVNKLAKGHGWIVKRLKHFCDEKCENDYLEKIHLNRKKNIRSGY